LIGSIKEARECNGFTLSDPETELLVCFRLPWWQKVSAAVASNVSDGQASADAAGIHTIIDNHTFRATGITAYLKKGVRLKRPLPWRTMPAPGQPSCTIEDRMMCLSMRLNMS